MLIVTLTFSLHTSFQKTMMIAFLLLLSSADAAKADRSTLNWDVSVETFGSLKVSKHLRSLQINC